MTPHPLHARKRLELYDAAHLLALRYGEPWMDAFENPNRAETFHYRRQCVKLVEEAVTCGDLVAAIVKEGQKPTIATEDVLAWLECIAPIASASNMQILGQIQSPKDDVQTMEQDLRAIKGLITIVEAMRLLQDETGERFPEILSAVHADEIKAYAPGRYNKPIPGNPSDRARLPRGVACGDDHLECFGSDLDAWLDKHFPRVKFRFSRANESRQSIWNDEVTCDCREKFLNGALVDWDHWSRRKRITPRQAAELAHCVEPDKGKIDEERSRLIQRLAESLVELSETWTLSDLVRHLGDKAPFNMKQAVASRISAPAKVGASETAKETPIARQIRLQKRCNELRSSSVKAWKKQTADEEGISTSFLDRILRRDTVPTKAKPGTIAGLKTIRKNNNGC